MITKLKNQIKANNDLILANKKKEDKYFELLNNATLQMQEIQTNLEKIQLENQEIEKANEKLNIVKEYLEEQE